ncbi:MAG: NTPase [candidate division NC10 bacterium]|jgi:nucleoside-triphosphatase|nr:NTPase [candidate division NC10 bacterium]MCH7895758.1 NTPase [candidate division NC10 bacterium]MCZ6550751.1 NTPase [candidate division NC10 bacterium]
MDRAHLITGPPGVGKTSLLLSLLESLPGSKGGFYTLEIREERQRVGFQIADLAGREGILAHVRRPGPPRVGRYGVDLKTFEVIGVQAIIRALDEADLIVIDEIGKMELYSPLFQTVLFQILESSRPLLATILTKAHPIADRIKVHPDVRLHRLGPTNRQEVAQAITADLTRWIAG